MVELTEIGARVMNALIQAEIAWQSPAQLAAKMGHDEHETTDTLCELDLAGWVEVWDSADGPLVTLSALGAERLSVRLIEVGAGLTPRWASSGDPDPPAQRSKNVCAGLRGASLDYVVDPCASPEEVVDRHELATSRAGGRTDQSSNLARIEQFPRPTQLLGLGLSPWPGRFHPGVALAECPACGNRKLTPQMYCLYCDRWGLDLALGLPMPKIIPTPKPARPPVSEAILRERAKERRKAKRRRRRAREIDAAQKEKAKLHPNGQPSSPPNSKPNTEPASRFAQPPASRSSSPSASR